MSLDDRIPATMRQKADSPFIPGTAVQFAWDSVSLTSALSCPRRYQLQIIQGQRPRATSPAVALSFGILFHKGLELYHKARALGHPHNDAAEQALATILAHPETAALPTDEEVDEAAEAHDPDEDDGIALRNSKIRTRYYLARALVWYFEHYGAEDKLRTFHLISGEPAVEVSFRLPLPIEVGDHPLLLCGHIDRVVEYENSLYASDYKTTKSLTRQFTSTFDLSHQMTGYTVAGTALFDRPTRGVWIDGIALQVGSVKFGRSLTTRTPGQIGEYFELLSYVSHQALGWAERYGECDYPMNTASCFFCEFKEVCRQPPEYRQSYLRLHFEPKKGWNPLENR